jgi:hypothetical protein
MYAPGVFASGGEDHLIAVWDLERRGDLGADGEAPEPKRPRASLPPQLMFQHAGHRSQVGAAPARKCYITVDVAGTDIASVLYAARTACRWDATLQASHSRNVHLK